MCMADMSDGGPEVHRAKIVRARKAHRCDECGRPIAAGERYEYVFSIFEGDWYTNHTCVHCVEVRRWLDVACRGWIYTAVHEDIREHWDESDLARTVAMGRLIHARDRTWRARDDGTMWTPYALSKWVDEALVPVRAAHARAA